MNAKPQSEDFSKKKEHWMNWKTAGMVSPKFAS